MKNKLHHVYNLIILDESGSMEGIKRPTIRGFNEVVETIKHVENKFPDQKHFISLVSFNGGNIKRLLWNEAVRKLSPLNEELYQPGLATPLYDAIGKSVTRLKKDLPKGTSYNVLVTILTDGEENSSRVYSVDQVKALIDALKEESWTFAYIGANHNVDAAAQRISITNTLEFKANEADMDRMYAIEKKARMAMAEMTASKKSGESIQFNTNFYNAFQQLDQE